MERVIDSAFMEECHECDNVTRHMWKTKRATVRACSEKCAKDFESGAGSIDDSEKYLEPGAGS